MISVLEFGRLAQYVYKDATVLGEYRGVIKRHFVRRDFNPSLKEDGFYEVMIDRAVQSKAALSHGFYASLFIKVKDKRAVCAVIAIRGTNNWDNDKQDVKSWWRSFFDSHARVIFPEHYMTQAKHFYFKVRRYCLEHLKLPNSKIFVTGHSLGGALAALLPTYYGFPLRAVTFNAPGIQDVAGVKPLWHRVINFRARYDFVSAIDYPIGVEWNMSVADHEQQAAKSFAIAREHEAHGWTRLNLVEDLVESIDFLVSVKHQHSMANLMGSLRQSAAMPGGLTSSDTFGAGQFSVEAVSSVRDNQPYDRFHPFSPQRRVAA